MPRHRDESDLVTLVKQSTFLEDHPAYQETKENASLYFDEIPLKFQRSNERSQFDSRSEKMRFESSRFFTSTSRIFTEISAKIPRLISRIFRKLVKKQWIP